MKFIELNVTGYIPPNYPDGSSAKVKSERFISSINGGDRKLVINLEQVFSIEDADGVSSYLQLTNGFSLVVDVPYDELKKHLQVDDAPKERLLPWQNSKEKVE